MPPPIREAIAAALESYPRRHQVLPELLKRHKGRRRRGRRVAPDSVTRKSALRTVAHVRLIVFALSHCSLDSLEVGRYDRQSGKIVRHFDLHELVQATGLGWWRLGRSISDNVDADFFYRHQGRLAHELPDKSIRYEGLVARFKVTKSLFAALGVPEGRLDLFRQRGQEADAKAARKRQRRQRPVGKVAAVIAEALGRAEGGGIEETNRLAFNQLCFQVAHEHPEWDSDRVRAVVRQRLKPPPTR